tara:strand:- start:668 stop:1105 length:438 start_codon:yes stop_codon:yes gene_type:complete
MLTIALSQKYIDPTNAKDNRIKRFVIQNHIGTDKYNIVVQHFDDKENLKAEITQRENKQLCDVFYSFFRYCNIYNLGFKIKKRLNNEAPDLENEFKKTDKFMIPDNIMNEQIARFYYKPLKSRILKNENDSEISTANFKWFYYNS